MKRIFSIFLVFLFLIPLLARSADVPVIVYPKSFNSVFMGRIELKWSSTGVESYKYRINLPDGTKREETVRTNSAVVYDLKSGSYSWSVASVEGSDEAWSNNESFTVAPAPAELIKGIFPCGRQYDDPKTELVESKPCRISDLLILLNSVLDFFLWRVATIALIVVIIAASIIASINSKSSPLGINARNSVKIAVRYYIIIVLAWLVVNALLALLGYKIGIFGWL